MIDPDHLTDVNRDSAGLEELAIFAVLAKAQTAKLAAKVTEELFEPKSGISPFEQVRRIARTSATVLVGRLLSRYGGTRFPHQKGRTLSALAFSDLDLTTCSRPQLQSIYGIGYKTAELFLLHSRPDHRDICPDVHVLRWLKARHPRKRIPEQSPSDPRVLRRLKNLWLWECDKAGMSPAALDLQVWRAGSGRG